MVVKKIFDEIFDDEVHNNFLKFGRGEYKNKFLLNAKKQSNKWVIKAGPEFANSIVKMCVEKDKGKVEIRGVIIATRDLSKELSIPFQKISNFQGVRTHKIEATVEASHIIEAMEKYPRAFFAISFSGSDFDLKTKTKVPKPGKGKKSTEDEEAKADFCSLKTTDKNIVKNLFFDVDDFKEVSISHTIKVENIVYPKNMDQLSPTDIREQSKRQGILERKILIDGKEKISKVKFVA